MNKKPRVGIALLAYNQGKYVDDAIDSLKKQTFQDFEVFLIDDGSDDGFTAEKLEDVAYDKITKKYLYKENVGNAVRRAGMYKKIDNEFILDMSADDILEPAFLEKTVGFLNDNEKYGAVSTNIKLFVSRPEDFYAQKCFDASLMNLQHVLARNQILGSSLMRKKALDETDLSGGFTRYQDWDRWISMMEVGWKIGLVPEFLFDYRQVKTSLSHSASVEDELKIRKKLLKKHAASYQKYYEDVIIEMESAFLELLEGKNWLDEQYNGLKKEVEQLSSEVEMYRNESGRKLIKRGFAKAIDRIRK